MNQNQNPNAGKNNVYVSITARDKPDLHVYMRATAACVYSNSQGTSTSLGSACSPYAVHVARNRAVASIPDDATHLMFVDNDIWLQEDAIELLLSVPCDIAVGCYAQITQGGQIAPYIAIHHNDKWLRERFDGVLENVQWAGTGCMLIRREVFDALEFPWFQWPLSLQNGKVKEISDDVDFCRRATEAGFTIGAHGNVFCSHQKSIDSAVLFSPGWMGPKTLEQQMSQEGQHVPA